MDDQDQYDSVQWERGAEPQSPPAFPQTSELPSRPAPDRRRSSNTAEEPQAGENADETDIAGIGREGRLEVTVDTPLKENEGTKDAYVSYLVSTHVGSPVTAQEDSLTLLDRLQDLPEE